MTKFTRQLLGLGGQAVVAGLFFSLLVSVAAAEPDDQPTTASPAAIAAPGTDAPELERVAYWQTRGAAARERVAETERLLAEANGAVSRMQRRNHPRGAARQQLRAEQHHAREAHADAVEYLEIDLPAQARAARAQISWLRDPSERVRAGTHGRPPARQR